MQPICSIDGCDRRLHKLKMCELHYRRDYFERNPDQHEKRKADARERAKKRRSTPEGKEAHRLSTILSKYGLNKEEYLSRLEATEGKCEACGDEFDRTPFIDHDHSCCPHNNKKTCGNCVRGILCLRCNSILGYCKDSPETLMKIISYISERKAS